MGGALMAITILALWRHREPVAGIAAGLAAAILVAGVVAPSSLRGVERAWMRLAVAISRVTTPILMGVIYFGIFTPVGVAMRLAGRRTLIRQRDAQTFWIDRDPDARRSDLRRQF
jgi:hypothetical protein